MVNNISLQSMPASSLHDKVFLILTNWKGKVPPPSTLDSSNICVNGAILGYTNPSVISILSIRLLFLLIDPLAQSFNSFGPFQEHGVRPRPLF